jgi:hypothetical protein
LSRLPSTQQGPQNGGPAFNKSTLDALSDIFGEDYVLYASDRRTMILTQSTRRPSRLCATKAPSGRNQLPLFAATQSIAFGTKEWKDVPQGPKARRIFNRLWPD